ncbi:LLM class flavin-dependent oxidoreductase [Rhodococcus sp. YH1]|uniref:LLM class flavin-dependent oxidoreductase n=1 Tax=Rhodococcus sp. YH1 TaxID=89066 RepID=UPI001386D5F9|nr:F420-dependent glucose-6-phosphate dehydrogenase [Rhodococcus sp. YH1]
MTDFSLFFNLDVAAALDDHDATARAYREAEEQSVLAERQGFDGIWVAEHHFASFGRSPAPLLFLSRLSVRTSTLRLGTAIAEAPHYHPLRLAEEAALLDHLSGGRLQLGLGTGGSSKKLEYELFGIDFDERNARMRDAARTVVAAFDGETVDLEGETYSVSGARIVPRPFQCGARAVWVAASDETTRFAGENGLGLLFGRAVTPARRAELLDTYRDALGTRPGRRASLIFAFPAETDEEAWERTLPVVRHYAELQSAVVHADGPVDWDGHPGTPEYFEILERLTFTVGSVERVTERLGRFIEDNEADELLLQTYAGASRHPDALAANDLLAREVLPHLRTVSRIPDGASVHGGTPANVQVAPVEQAMATIAGIAIARNTNLFRGAE